MRGERKQLNQNNELENSKDPHTVIWVICYYKHIEVVKVENITRRNVSHILCSDGSLFQPSFGSLFTCCSNDAVHIEIQTSEEDTIDPMSTEGECGGLNGEKSQESFPGQLFRVVCFRAETHTAVQKQDGKVNPQSAEPNQQPDNKGTFFPRVNGFCVALQ